MPKSSVPGSSVARDVLYNAAKLIEDTHTADLRVAIYTKLYDIGDSIDGSCVCCK
jgi:hypothetical protein